MVLQLVASGYECLDQISQPARDRVVGMLLRHTLVYFSAQVVASVLGFASLALYTHLTTPADFGLFRVVMTGVLLTNAVLFQWLTASALRFVSSAANHARFLSTILVMFVVVLFFADAAGLTALPFLPSRRTQLLWVMGIVLVSLQAWFGLNLSIVRAQLRPLAYGRLTVLRTGLVLVTSVGLINLGFKVWGLLGGASVGLLLPILLFTRSTWRGINLREFDKALVGRLLSYGLPLSASLSFSYVIEGSDRLLLGWLSGPASTGVYSAGYDLVQNALGAVMGIVNSAAFPLAVNALESGDSESATAQLRTNFSMLLAIALPAAVGLSIVSSQVARALLGVSFQVGAARLMPWVALGVLLSGLRAYYVDHAFQLGNRTELQIVVLGIGGATNVLLNLLLIPLIGPLGAAYSTVAAYGVALAIGILLSHKAFQLPMPVVDPLKVLVATALMAVAISPFRSSDGVPALVLEGAGGSCVYFVSLLLLNGLGLRTKLVRWALALTR